MMSLRNLFFRSVSPRRKPRHGNARTKIRFLAQGLLRIEALEARAMLTALSGVVGTPSVADFALAPGTGDSGIAPYAETFVDQVTNVTNPVMTGSAPEGSVVSVYVENDGNVNGSISNALLLGTATVPGTDPTQNATWTFTTPTSLNDPSVSTTQDGERTLFAQDSLDDPASYAWLNLYLDTIGPQVSSVTFGTGQDVFLSVPNGPTPSNNSIDITFTDSDIRTADFPSFSAVNNTLAHEISNYSLTGAAGGNIPVTSVNYTDLTQVGGPGVTEVQLNFASPLKDDVYTLNISDNLESDPGNALDGLVTQTPGGTDTIALPSGNGTPGSGSFAASFAVQGGLNLGVQLTQGFQASDLQAASAVTTTASPFYKPSDTVFSGNFQDPNTGLADGFSKLAGYGMNGGQYRFLFQSDASPPVYTQITSAVNGAGASVALPAGMPVSGDFDGNATNGDEVGIFTGKAWDLYSINLQQTGSGPGLGTTASPYSGTATLIKTVNWPVQGYPVAGDFNGDGITDLATWSNGNFYVSYASNGFTEIDAVIPLSFPGTNARPVAADVDGATNSATGDAISDLGLWVPATNPPSVSSTASWYFLPSGGTPLSQQTSFTPVQYQFGSSLGVPLTGNFSAVTLTGAEIPVNTSTSSAAVHLTAAPRMAAAKIAAPAAVTSLTVNGTPGNDTVQLTAGKMPGTWVLSVNGKTQTIASTVTTLHLNGLAGKNQLSILGTGKGETADIWANQTIFHSGNLTLTAANFNNTTVNGGQGSTDKVRYHDVAGNAWFVAGSNASSLTGTNYTALALNFSKTSVVSPSGKSDIANFFPSKSAAVVNSSVSSDVVQFSGQGVAAESAFFSKVEIYNQAGAVVKTIVPTPSSKVPARVFATTALGGAKSVSHSAAAAVLFQANTKSSGSPLPQSVDAVMASYEK